MQDEQIRSFIAIELPSEMKRRLKEFQARFKLPRHNFVRWVSPEAIHLTLKFLGNITPGQAEDIKSMLQAITCEHKAFDLHTARVGCFPNLKKVRVFWLGLEGDLAELISLHSSIDKISGKMGFAVENRPYAAHLTLARVREECTSSERWEFSELIKDAVFEPEYTLNVRNVSLMRSKLTPGGAVYTRLGEYALLE